LKIYNKAKVISWWLTFYPDVLKNQFCDKNLLLGYSIEKYAGKIRKKILRNVCFFTKKFPFFLEIGKLFAHFEKKMEKICENTKFSRNFLTIFP